MPSEIRRLVFLHDELMDALAMEAERPRSPLAGGRISNCEIVSRPEVTLRVELMATERGGGAAPRSVTLEPALVAAALIRFCKRRRIPLSRKAEKALHVVDGHLALNLTLEAPGMKIAAPKAAWMVE